jgi:tellurite resistance protein
MRHLTLGAVEPSAVEASSGTGREHEPDGATNATPLISGSPGTGDQLSASSAGPLLVVLAVPLGIAGLGGLWQVMRTGLSAPAWPSEVLFAISTTIWLALTIVYLAGGIRNRGSFAGDREHAVYGPFVAYIPVIGILLSAHYVQYVHNVGRTAVVLFILALGIQAAQLLAHWLHGYLPQHTFHPGYLLPAVAGAFIASIGLSACGWHQAARSAFGIGIFFWLVIGTLIFSRLFAGPPLPDLVKPSLSLLVSPPATAGIAWLLISEGTMGSVGYALLGILFIMLLVQVLFLREYLALSFTPNFWAFTFPIAASTSFVVRWLSSIQFSSWKILCWSATGLATALIVIIALGTLRNIYRNHV